MTTRPAGLQDFLDLTAAAIAARPLPVADRFVDTVFTALAAHRGAVGTTPPGRQPVCAQLPAALAAASAGPPPIAALGGALAALEPALNWTLRARAAESGEGFLHGHANAMIVGPGGLEERSDLWVGVSLMAPAVTYPDHSHPPEELYVVLAAGAWRQRRGDWDRRGAGDLVHNPPGIEHSMQSGVQPLLALWLLWIG